MPIQITILTIISKKTFFVNKLNHLITEDHLLTAIILFIILILILVLTIFIYLTYLRYRTYYIGYLKKKFDILIRKAIFMEEEEITGTMPVDENSTFIHIPPKMLRLLKKRKNRQVMLEDILQIKKDLSGVSADNLRRLYEQLGLQADSYHKLKSLHWHIKAKGIRELSTMDQKAFRDDIYTYTNDRNEFVRMEAQTAIVYFDGFEGLRFLNEITYPLSEWQQICLLELLHKMKIKDFEGVERWLRSSNDSIILFALRLVHTYTRFELHNEVVQCLRHANEKVRRLAIHCLAEIYDESTPCLLIKKYASETKKNKQAILRSLQKIRAEEAVQFLSEELKNEDDELKFMAARALVASTPNGWSILENHPEAGHFPLEAIIRHLKAEDTAA